MENQENPTAEDFMLIDKMLKKDLREAAKNLGIHEARYLVDLYYTAQKFRMATDSQKRAAEGYNEPTTFLSNVFSQFSTIEHNIQLSLDVYTDNHPIGKRVRTVKGMGPVMTAGLIANLKIALPRKAYIAEGASTELVPVHSVGAWWRYCGLDPTLKWTGREDTSMLLKEVNSEYEGKTDDLGKLSVICHRLNRRLGDVLYYTKHITSVFTSEEAFELCSVIRGDKVKGKAEFHADNIFKELLPDPAEPYRITMEDTFLSWDAIRKFLCKRPYNANLKRLCWLIGESFVKVKNREGAMYGKIYAETRAKYDVMNDNLHYQEEAARRLKANRTKMDKSLAKLYESGKLPDKALHERAKRVAVKMFLSHMHQVWFEHEFGRTPPEPYPIAILGHKDYVAPSF